MDRTGLAQVHRKEDIAVQELNDNRKFRIYFCASLESKQPPYIEHFDTVEQAQQAFETVANYTLYLHEKGLMKDDSNFGFIERFVHDEWLSIEDLADYQDKLSKG
ncbi:hypothetical protein [Idiomarina sp. UBA1919]|uniref:hypothetical protein n=1 Tax=Idiomarina sp. UBA1919 TaxID=1946640 RepID=UPI00257D1ED1|nr:hypothetical protein [Idiomarina sp. UBA1919]|tara:strand:+ start:863 stop:1177 length:315 start_codon:yes stop_codon:yes gene_type:complete